MNSLFQFYFNIHKKLFNWAVARSDRPRKRWHNLFYNFIALICDFVMAKSCTIKRLYKRYTLPYGMFDS